MSFNINTGVKINIIRSDRKTLSIQLKHGKIVARAPLRMKDKEIYSFIESKKATEMGFGAVCFEGNIDFYGKSGFTYASEFGIRYHGLPESEDASFFLCKELIPEYLNGITGEYGAPVGYFVNEDEAEEFDKQFPPKEKLKLPTQLF